MDIQDFQDRATPTTGRRLRQARENIGLSQQKVAEKLCLKVSTVRDIENDRSNPNLDSTFIRGYIRSYARLVHISEEELIAIIAKQAPIKTYKVVQKKKCLLKKVIKQKDNYLLWLTWLILFTMISLTGVWWWQNHQIQQQDITNIVNQYFNQVPNDNNATLIPLNTNTNVSSISIMNNYLFNTIKTISFSTTEKPITDSF